MAYEEPQFLGAAFRRARQRSRQAHFVRLFGVTACIALAAAAALLAALARSQASMTPGPMPVTFVMSFLALAAALALCAAFSFAATWLTTPPPERFARRLDRALDLRDGLATALAMRRDGAATPMLDLLEESLMRRTGRLNIRSLLPRLRWPAVGLLVLLAAATFAPPVFRASGASLTAPDNIPGGAHRPLPGRYPWDPKDWNLVLAVKEKSVFAKGEPIRLTTTLESKAGPVPLDLRGPIVVRVTGKPLKEPLELENLKSLILKAGASGTRTDFTLGNRGGRAYELPVGKYKLQLKTTLGPRDAARTGEVSEPFRKHSFRSNTIPIEVRPPDGGASKPPPSPRPTPPPRSLAELLARLRKSFVDPQVNKGREEEDKLIRWKKIEESLSRDPKGKPPRPYRPTPEERKRFREAIERAINNESIPLKDREYLKRFYERN